MRVSLNRIGETHVLPVLGVIGHMRTYKSEKQIWIAPYRKGKERNNPAHISQRNM